MWKLSVALQGVATRTLNHDFCFFPLNVSLTLIHSFRITFIVGGYE